MEADDCSEEGLTAFRQTPASCSGDFGDQAADVQAFDLSGDGIRPATPEMSITCRCVQLISDVGVLEAAHLVTSGEDGRTFQGRTAGGRGLRAH